MSIFSNRLVPTCENVHDCVTNFSVHGLPAPHRDEGRRVITKFGAQSQHQSQGCNTSPGNLRLADVEESESLWTVDTDLPAHDKYSKK